MATPTLSYRNDHVRRFPIVSIQGFIIGAYNTLMVMVVNGSWRLPCSSFLVMTCLLITYSDILATEELHRSPQVVMCARWDSGLMEPHPPKTCVPFF